MSLNSWAFSGYLGGDPDFSFSSNGNAFCKFSVAVQNYNFKEKEKVTMWVRVTAFGPLAEKVEKHMSKGDFVEVVGRVEENKWKDPEGNLRTSIQVISNTVEFTPGKARSKPSEDYQTNEEIESDAADAFNPYEKISAKTGK